MIGYTDQVRSSIEKISYNQIFVASEFKKKFLPELPEAIFYKSLERLTKQDKLVHLAKGLYYRPFVENDKIIPITTEAIVDYYVGDNEGIIVGEQLFVEKGITSTSQERLQLISRKIIESKKSVGEVQVQKTDLELNKETIAVIEALEILQNYNKIPQKDKHRFISYIHDFVEEYSDQVTEYVLAKRKYKKSTIAFLARILDWYGVYHSLNEYLSPLSNYKIPTIEDLKLEIPDEIQIRLKEYVEGVKKIYNNHLDRIILYGSYAKGNYSDGSDIDIMILLDISVEDVSDYRYDISQFTYDFNMEFDLDIMPMVQSSSVYYKWINAHPFYKNVEREGIKLYGAA